MITQEESIQIAESMKDADILVSHDKAYIWDMIVLPPDIEKSASQTDINLFTGELKRVLNFAALADNKMEILYGELRKICSTLNVDMFKMLEDEEEQYKPKEQ